jgi:curved DNA-binding protein CbpA
LLFTIQLLGVEQDASNEAIVQAFRRLSKEKHPDKNPDDCERATRDYQKLTHAKIILLDAEKRRKHDEDLIDSGVRNEKALPLFCSICSRNIGRHARRCLKGFGHKSPLIEEFHAAQGEYRARGYSQNRRCEKAKFIKCLERVLGEFVKNEFPKLYPLAKAPNRRQQAAGNEDLPLPRFVNDVLKQCYLSMRDETSEETGAFSMPTASEVSNLLEACQLRPTRRRETTNLPSTNKFPMYDLSTLSDKELRLILDYLRLPYETTANREVLENMANRYCPMVVLLPNLDNQSLNLSRECGRCSNSLSLMQYYFSKATSTVCFSCNKICCSNCLMGMKWKIPFSGSFDLRTICSECFRILKIFESQSWLERGIALLESDQRRTETVLAMYRISNALRPSDVAIIHQAKVLYAQKKYTTLAEFGKEILLDESALTKDNRTVLLYFVAESLLKVAGAMPETDLMSKVELYKDAIDWIERFNTLVDERIYNLKLKAIRMRLALLSKRDEIIKKKAAMVLSQLTQAIKEGSFLKALLVTQDEDEDNDEVMHLCWQKLLKESNENYNEYSRLLLRLFKAIAQHEQGNSTAAINEVADVFWSGYELFQSQDRSIPIVDYVVQFTSQLILNEASLPLQNVAGINVSNFLSTLQLTEEDLINPPDIDDRKWRNLTVEGCDMKMFLKYETAVKKLVEKKKWMPLDAAFAYHDLLTACQHPAQLLFTIITSAQWFTRQISCSDSNDSCLFACKKMITKLTNLAAALAFEFSTQPYMRYYVAKLVIALQFYSSLKTGHEGQETANFIGVHMKWLVATGRHCPLHKMPMVTPTEAVLMSIISTKLHCEYLLKLQDAIPAELRPMSEAIMRYQIYENCWFKRGNDC